MHIALPPRLAEAVVGAGWAEVHPVARAGRVPKNLVMLYGPRDPSEVDVLFDLVLASYRYAGGRLRET